jgi:penicillin-binding protein 1A
MKSPRIRLRGGPERKRNPEPEAPAPPITRRGVHRLRRRPRSGLLARLNLRWALAGFAALCVLVAALLGTLYLVIDVPPANAQAKAQSNVFRYADGTRVARTGEINRESVPIRKVPVVVRHAFVAAENKTFYEGGGIDPLGMTRALFNTLTGKGKQGGSTITQQYVKNYYLSQQQTVTRKIKELVISLKVDHGNAKNDILAGYLNTSYFGRNAYGIQAAARAYYDKDVQDLTAGEGAYLAALLQAPSQYDWAVATPTAKQLVKQRWHYVLRNMTEMHWLSHGTEQVLPFPKPVQPKPSSGLAGQTGYLLDAATRELISSGISEQQLAAGGWNITLNIDRHRQRQLERSVRAEEAASSAHTKPLTHKGTSSAGASLSRRQTGAVSLDPANGHVLALYGGRDYATHPLSNATRADYQAGAVFQPVMLAGEMEQSWARQADGHRPIHGRAAIVANLKKTAVRLGMDPHAPGLQPPRQKALTLGLMGTSPLEMAGVYAAFDHDGYRVNPTIVKSARRVGEAFTPSRTGRHRAISEKTAGMVTKTLATDTLATPSGPMSFPSPFSTARPVAESGTSDDKKASWSVGYTPQMVTAVGVFGENPETRKQITLPGAARNSARSIRSSYDQTGPDQTGPDKDGPGRTGTRRTGADKTGSPHQTGPDKDGPATSLQVPGDSAGAGTGADAGAGPGIRS